MIEKTEITDFFKSLQDNICNGLIQADGKAKFEEEVWERDGGGGGRTRIMQNGNVIEKGGVNFSAVHGELPQSMVKALGVTDNRFFATGVSIVMHPQNPMVPIIHMNVRYFCMEDGTYWFGGGIDLTPHYINDEDAKFFHQSLKETCDKYNAEYYPKFKTWADDYFFINHRKETRGIGGIFFDKLNATEGFTERDCFEFVKAVGNTFLPTYTHFMNKNKNLPFTEEQKEWQYLRRGRYVEFNLVWDKGTKFGLDTDGRTESILMSLPPQANWFYNFKPKASSEEERTLGLLKKGVNWV
jgi:coproporphyrinogen III oxidase